jgi:hypothetical protein
MTKTPVSAPERLFLAGNATHGSRRLPQVTGERWGTKMHAGDHREILRTLLLVTLITPLLAAGCAGGPNPPQLLRSADLRLPLDDYLLSPSQLAEIADGSRTLVRQCMAGLGLDSPAQPPPGPAPRTWNDWRYGLTDPTVAAQRGYRRGDHPPTAQPEPAAAQPRAEQAGALTGEGARSIHGRRVPEGGCLGQAERTLRGSGPPGVDRDLAQRLSMDSFGYSRGRPRVRAAVARWSDCMKRRGLDYPDPFGPVKEPRFQAPGAAVTATEIATAVADVACKQQINLVGIWFTVERSYQQSLVAENRAGLDRVRQANNAELAAARALR